VIERLGLNRSTPRRSGEIPALTMDQEPRRQLPTASAGPRHCWVIDAPECPGRWPGVLLGWEQDGKGWLGRVMVAVEGRQGMVTMTLWIRAEHLRPVKLAEGDGS
jgi:hypothetical protein